MFLVLAIILSITLISFSCIRRSSNKEYITSPFMTSYYESLFNTNKQQSYNCLLKWCTDLLERFYFTEKQEGIVEPLYKQRLVSEEMYDKIQEDLKNMNNEKMIIEQEAQAYSRNIFKECKVKQEDNKMYKIYEDIHFNKKREALEMELRKRLMNKNL
ncbi:translocation protein sec66 [Vairimorpha ceranae]|uniref:Translocation protein sec66 n=1 Tax=Vairimorpha ceranae TaxID=40302 RepID=A0A0F9WQ91_9MICR|nr:translocation protein sec66 [Vairimorpha ceranae]KAF5141094.1 hypothetical protein G9O61_00g007850 [Vairimorpha ceranae]KKO75113.1 translocation protein sec66 [Vairimorpha ceranae]